MIVIHIGKTVSLDLHLTLFINTRRIANLNGTEKIIKLSKEKIKEHCHDFGVGKAKKCINRNMKYIIS